MKSTTDKIKALQNVECKLCKKEITRANLARHNKSKDHISKVESIEGILPQSTKNEKYKKYEDIIDRILISNQEQNINNIYCNLKHEYTLQEIEKILRLGYFRPYYASWEKKEARKNEAFMRGLKLDIAEIEDATPKADTQGAQTLVSTIYDKLQTPDTPPIAKLYLLLPIRTGAFCDLIITTAPIYGCRTYINISTGELFVYDNKSDTEKYVKLDKQTCDILPMLTDYIGTNKPILPNTKALHRLLSKYINATTCDIKKAYMNYNTDKRYAERLLL